MIRKQPARKGPETLPTTVGIRTPDATQQYRSLMQTPTINPRSAPNSIKIRLPSKDKMLERLNATPLAANPKIREFCESIAWYDAHNSHPLQGGADFAKNAIRMWDSNPDLKTPVTQNFDDMARAIVPEIADDAISRFKIEVDNLPGVAKKLVKKLGLWILEELLPRVLPRALCDLFNLHQGPTYSYDEMLEKGMLGGDSD